MSICADLVPQRLATYLLIAFYDPTHFVLKLWDLKQRSKTSFYVLLVFCSQVYLEVGLNRTYNSF